MSTAKKSQAGFTLVELLVAVVVLAVGLLGLAQLQVSAIKVNSQSATTTAAAAVAQKVVEEIAAMGADDPMFDGPSAGVLTWTESTNPVTVAGGGTYAITYKVEEVKPSPGTTVTNLYKVTVYVDSTTKLQNILGNKVRSAQAVTIKRAI